MTAPRYPEIGVVTLVADRWWADVWMTQHQILTRLGAWFHVLWVDRAPDWRDAWGARAEELARTGTFAVPGTPPGFRVFRPGRWLPTVYRPAVLGRALDRLRLHAARRLLRARGARHLITYLWRPRFAWALDAGGACGSVYHVVDEYTYSADDPPVSVAEERLLRAVDRVIVTTATLWEKRGGYNPASSLIPNGVDYAAFSTPQPEAAALAAIPRPRIGYIGFLKKMLDLPLLIALARRHPSWSFVYIGVDRLPPDDAAALRALDNVHLLGQRSHDDLPAYVQHMDVCTMPYVLDGYTKYIYPLKLHEYLAAGRPTVSTPLPAVLPFRDVVTLASGVDEWSAALTAALRDGADADAARRRQAVAREYDWDAITERIAHLLLELTPAGRDRATPAAALTAVG
jgi:glycosyltransferase involved in cell wall biosynthesis